MDNLESIKNLESWLDSFLNFEKLPQKGIFWLDTMEFLCKRFHYPQDCFKSIHVAGSKGKGSVSTMIACIIEEYGFSCGLYTSPHINTFAERITECGSFFSDKIYQSAFNELMPSIDAIIPEQLPSNREITWFELVTLYAFLVFKHAKLDWAVFETGLGGRLDATNVLCPNLCVLTPIELEHTAFLGDSLPKIAREKAGIIKEKTLCFSSEQKNCVKEVFDLEAQNKQTKVNYVDDFLISSNYRISDDGMDIELNFGDLFYRPIKTKLKLKGECQMQNAALAILCVKHIFPSINEVTIEKGLQKAFLQCRFEEIPAIQNKQPKLIIDGAHTVNSINLTLQTIKNSATYNEIDVLFACAADKNIVEFPNLFFNQDYIKNITLTNPGKIKKGDFPLLKDSFKNAQKINKNITCIYEENYQKAIDFSLKNALKNNRTLLVIGSFYLASELKKNIINSSM